MSDRPGETSRPFERIDYIANLSDEHPVINIRVRILFCWQVGVQIGLDLSSGPFERIDYIANLSDEHPVIKHKGTYLVLLASLCAICSFIFI